MGKIIFTMLFLLIIKTALACNCADIPTINESWENSTQIFIAKVIFADSIGQMYGSYGQPIKYYILVIKEMFKGEIYLNYYQRTFFDLGNGSCDYEFKKNAEYLVYALADARGFLKTSICFRTSELSKIEKEELNELRLLKSNAVKENTKEMRVPEESINSEINLLNSQLKHVNERYEVVKIFIFGFFILNVLLIILLVRKRKSKNQ